MRTLFLSAVAVIAIGLAPTRAEIAIAMAGPMTGAYAWMGEQNKRGVEAAVDEINAKGGLLGQQVRVIVGDDACDAAQAVAVANKLIHDGAVFVAGHYCSHTSIAASRVYEQRGILMISPASTNPRLTDEGGDNVFRVAGRDDLQGEIAGDYLADRWGEKAIAILHDGTTYGKGLADEARKRLNARGTTEAFSPGESDYSALVSRMQAAGIDVFYIGGYNAEAALIVRQARTRDFDAQLVSGDGIVTEDFWLIAGPAGEGALMTFFPNARGTPEAAHAVEAFRARGYEPEGYTLHAYAAVQVWAQAVESAGTLDLHAVIGALRGTRFDTVLGTLEFDEKGDVTTAGFTWYVWREGRYVPRD